MAQPPKSEDISDKTPDNTPPVPPAAAPAEASPPVSDDEVAVEASPSDAGEDSASRATPIEDAVHPDAPSAEDLPSTFEAMGLPAPMITALAKMGWDAPTKVQGAAFGPVTAGRDVLVQSQTGSGKTGAFCLPWLAARFEAGDAKDTGVQLLVMTPTRELAKQVCDQLIGLAGESPVVPLPVYGGTAIGPQFDALRAGVHAVVGTPGRILDHIRRRTLDLSRIRTVVLDEADEMLSMGFLEDIHAILDACPRERQTTLFSATVPSDIERIARRYMNAPESLKLSGDDIAAAQIEHTYYSVPGMMRTRDLMNIVAQEEPGSTLIFCNTREETNLVANVLRKEGFSAEALSSDLSQAAREHVLGAMRKGRLRFLVATDVASRGIDISHISHVVNYSFPQNAESYVHRTGRTGRAGRAGKAISLIGPHDMGNFYHLKLAYPSIEFSEAKLPPTSELEARRHETKLDLISKRFPELVSPEWTLLARTLASDPRGEQVVAYLLSEAMSKPDPRTVVARDLPAEADQDEGFERGRRGRRGGERDRGERDRGERDRGRRRRGRDEDADRDATSFEGDDDGTRRRRRRRRRDVDDDDAKTPPSVLAKATPETEGERSEQAPPAGDETASADASGERRRRRRRRRRGKPGADGDIELAAEESTDTSSDGEQAVADEPTGPTEPAPVTDYAAAIETPNGDVGLPENPDETDDSLALVSADAELESLHEPDDGASARGRRRRRRRRRRGGRGKPGLDAKTDDTHQSGDVSVSTSADAAETETNDDEPNGKRRRRRRRGGRGKKIAAEAVEKHVPQDQIIIDIDESELEVVRDEFGEIDELDDLTLKGRRRGVIDALQDEVELEDLSEEDKPAEGADDEPDHGGENVDEDEATADEDGAADDAEASADEGDDADDDAVDAKEAKKRKRRRRRRKKKKAEEPPPELTAPPHKDFWEVWSAKFTFREFEDDQFRGGTEAIVDEPEPEPKPRRTSRPRRGDDDKDPAKIGTESGPMVTVALNVGRSHGKKSAHIRELLASDFGLEGRSVRNLTVKETLTEFRVSTSAYEGLQNAVLGYVFDDIELELVVVEAAPAVEPPSAPPEDGDATDPGGEEPLPAAVLATPESDTEPPQAEA